MKIKYKFTTEFFIVVLVSLALALIDLMIYFVIGPETFPLPLVALVMAFTSSIYATVRERVYVKMQDGDLFIRKNGPMNPFFTRVKYSDMNTGIVVGATLTIYYLEDLSIDVELGDMSPVDALALVGHLKVEGVKVETI